MNHLAAEIAEAIAILSAIKNEVDLLKRERDIFAKQNVDLRRRLKKLQPVGRNE